MNSEIRFNAKAIRVFDCVREGWAAIAPNYLLYLGMNVIFFIVFLLVSFVPYIGGIMSNMVSAALVCGYLMAVLASFRGETPNLTLLFEGFSRFVPAFLIVLFQSIPAIFMMFAMASYVLAALGITPEMVQQGITPEQIAERITPDLMGPIALGYGLIFLSAFLMKIPVFFAMSLVADRNLGTVEAITLSFRAMLKNAGGVFLMIFLQLLLIVVGLLMLCIGLFFIVPLYHAVEVAAYRQVFMTAQDDLHENPPSPENYEDDLA